MQNKTAQLAMDTRAKKQVARRSRGFHVIKKGVVKYNLEENIFSELFWLEYASYYKGLDNSM